MKIIIAYASAGAGHLKAAQALYKCLSRGCAGSEVKLIDCLNLSSGLYKFCYTRGYNFLIRRATLIWGLAFWITQAGVLRFLMLPLSSFLNDLNTAGFASYLINERADFVISTHFLPSNIAANLKKSNKINTKLITCITDFGVHPFWLYKNTDCYVVASGFTKNILIKEGVDAKKIIDSGIPIDQKFNQQYDKNSLCAKLGLDPGKFTLLIMTGSFGIGPIEEICLKLHNDVQILVVCANNKKLFERLNSKNYPFVKVFGFVDNVEELMSVSDCIVTKPGGLSIEELLARELVPIFISAIPGQETVNASFLNRLGVSLYAVKAEEIKKSVLGLKNHPARINEIREKIRMIKKPDSASELCNAICQGRI